MDFDSAASAELSLSLYCWYLPPSLGRRRTFTIGMKPGIVFISVRDYLVLLAYMLKYGGKVSSTLSCDLASISIPELLLNLHDIKDNLHLCMKPSITFIYVHDYLLLGYTLAQESNVSGTVKSPHNLRLYLPEMLLYLHDTEHSLYPSSMIILSC